jgi:hypothetical protein
VPAANTEPIPDTKEAPDPPRTEEISPSAPEGTPADVSGLVESRDPPEAGSRRAGRILLLPLRGVWFVLWSPIRLAAWAYDRFAVQTRFRQIFFSEDGRLGLFPTAGYKTGFGPSAGARFVLRDLFADKARLKLEATYGGEVVQAYKLRYKSGKLFGRSELDLKAGFETFPRNRFFGFGNGDEAAPGAMGVNPLIDNTAIDTRFYYDAFAVETGYSLDLPGPFRGRLGAGYRLREFDLEEKEDGDLNTFEVYDPAHLAGAMDGLSNVYGEAALVLDTLRQPQFYVSQAIPSRGWYAVARAGYAKGFDKDPSDYLRWGLDVQRYINLYADDRILMLRGVIEGVTGELADIPFLDVPKLGGGALLRGYPQDRFRDRQAGVISAEYQWSVDRNVAAFLFTDAGRVWRNREELGNGNFRVGFGGGIQLHSMKNFLARALLASSIDGGVFFLFSLDPLFEKGNEQ